jgi:hypothetical protein
VLHPWLSLFVALIAILRHLPPARIVRMLAVPVVVPDRSPVVEGERPRDVAVGVDAHLCPGLQGEGREGEVLAGLMVKLLKLDEDLGSNHIEQVARVVRDVVQQAERDYLEMWYGEKGVK